MAIDEFDLSLVQGLSLHMVHRDRVALHPRFRGCGVQGWPRGSVIVHHLTRAAADGFRPAVQPLPHARAIS